MFAKKMANKFKKKQKNILSDFVFDYHFKCMVMLHNLLNHVSSLKMSKNVYQASFKVERIWEAIKHKKAKWKKKYIFCSDQYKTGHMKE